MTDLTAAEQQWRNWIHDACVAVEVDPAVVDVTGIHGLTKEIAHGFARPMAPVGSYILGLAVGSRGARGHPVHVPRAAMTAQALRPQEQTCLTDIAVAQVRAAQQAVGRPAVRMIAGAGGSSLRSAVI